MPSVQLSRLMASSICDVAHDLEHWGRQDKLEYWSEIVWLTSPELSPEQWDWIKEVTSNSIRRRPESSADLREWIVITRTAYLENKFDASPRFGKNRKPICGCEWVDTRKDGADGETR